MKAQLAEQARISPLEFNPDETKKYIDVLAERQKRNRDCCKDLFVGVFFDGTNNNADRDRKTHSHSNVARLSDVFPRNEEANGFFRIYAPGVGTQFDDIGDSGAGDDLVLGNTDRRRGLAFAEKGEARITWALLTVINKLHFHFAKRDLLDFQQMKKLANDLTEANTPLWANLLDPRKSTLDQWIRKKRQLIDQRRNEALSALCRKLERAAHENKPNKKILGIRLSVFGFSRGSAQARAFSNWFVDMCRAASGGSSLAGLQVHFDFLGIFDTVASVGLANSTVLADGHMEWADAERNLRIPGEVKRCVHLVSAHELRRSFPLDSIAVGQKLHEDYAEIVYPGVHSDVGGGYKPCEQGRGVEKTGNDVLSRVALGHMYREARLANVPLDIDATGVTSDAKAAMTIAASTVEAFNAYLDECTVKSGKLSAILDEQTRLYVRWRRLRIGTMESLPSVQRCQAQDKTDLLEADRELAQEARLLAAPISPPDLKLPAVPPVTLLKIGLVVADAYTKHGIDSRHHAEWLRLKADWEAPGRLPPAVARLFDDWVHDSRAWFKPLGDDDHIWEQKQLPRMKRLERQQRDNDAGGNRSVFRQLVEAQDEAQKPSRRVDNLIKPLSDAEKLDLDTWKSTGQLPTQPTGREPFSMGGGYLRYRRVYFGSDAHIVANGPSVQRPIAESVA